jgi:hypothetical protein
MVGEVSRPLKKEAKHKALVILNRMCAKVRVQELTVGLKNGETPFLWQRMRTYI